MNLSPEMILSLAKAIPESKITDARKAAIMAILEKEQQAGGRLMAVMKLNQENTCLVFCIYKESGEYLASWPVYDLNTLMALLDAVKKFDFTQKTPTLSHEQPEPTAAAPGLPHAGGSASATPDESINGNGEYYGPGANAAE